VHQLNTGAIIKHGNSYLFLPACVVRTHRWTLNGYSQAYNIIQAHIMMIIGFKFRRHHRLILTPPSGHSPAIMTTTTCSRPIQELKNKVSNTLRRCLLALPCARDDPLMQLCAGHCSALRIGLSGCNRRVRGRFCWRSLPHMLQQKWNRRYFTRNPG